MYCGDSSCRFASAEEKRGQHTNGGCRCLQDLPADKRRELLRYISALEGALRPFAAFGEYSRKRPRLGLDDVMYALDGGPDCGGIELRRSDCERALKVLKKEK